MVRGPRASVTTLPLPYAERRVFFAEPCDPMRVHPEVPGMRNGDHLASALRVRATANTAISGGQIGATGFEPATFRPPAECATRLRHAPKGYRGSAEPLCRLILRRSGRPDLNRLRDLGRVECNQLHLARTAADYRFACQGAWPSGAVCEKCTNGAAPPRCSSSMAVRADDFALGDLVENLLPVSTCKLVGDLEALISEVVELED
jgi:hypothetical protein